MAAAIRPILAAPTRTLREEIEALATARPETPAWIAPRAESAAQTWTLADVVGLANRYARFAIVAGAAAEQGRRGARVAVVMPAGPQRTAALLGLAMAGAAAAPVPETTPPDTLGRWLTALAAPHVLLAPAWLDRFETAVPHLRAPAQVWVDGTPHLAYMRLDEALAGFAETPLERLDRRPIRPDTTALVVPCGPVEAPAAVRISHRRVLALGHALATGLDLADGDRLALPPGASALDTLVAALAVWTAGGAIAEPVGSEDLAIQPTAPRPLRRDRWHLPLIDGLPLIGRGEAEGALGRPPRPSLPVSPFACRLALRPAGEGQITIAERLDDKGAKRILHAGAAITGDQWLLTGPNAHPSPDGAWEPSVPSDLAPPSRRNAVPT